MFCSRTLVQPTVCFPLVPACLLEFRFCPKPRSRSFYPTLFPYCMFCSPACVVMVTASPVTTSLTVAPLPGIRTSSFCVVGCAG